MSLNRYELQFIYFINLSPYYNCVGLPAERKTDSSILFSLVDDAHLFW
jgi:hypothetical protein